MRGPAVAVAAGPAQAGPGVRRARVNAASAHLRVAPPGWLRSGRLSDRAAANRPLTPRTGTQNCDRASRHEGACAPGPRIRAAPLELANKGPSEIGARTSPRRTEGSCSASTARCRRVVLLGRHRCANHGLKTRPSGCLPHTGCGTPPRAQSRDGRHRQFRRSGPLTSCAASGAILRRSRDACQPSLGMRAWTVSHPNEDRAAHRPVRPLGALEPDENWRCRRTPRLTPSGSRSALP